MADNAATLRKLQTKHFAKGQCILSGQMNGNEFIAYDKKYKLEIVPGNVRDAHVYVYGRITEDTIIPCTIGDQQTALYAARSYIVPTYKLLTFGILCVIYGVNINRVRRLSKII